MELKIKEFQLPEEIEFNFQELKTAIANMTEKHKGVVYDESQMKTAKLEKADLNKLFKALEDERKRVKKECLAPYDLFASDIKTLTDMVLVPVNEISSQITKSEEIRKEAKKKEVEVIFNKEIGDLNMLLSFNRIFKEKWLNASEPIKRIGEEIKSLIGQINDDLKVIDDLDSIYTLQAKDKYLDSFSLTSALTEVNRLKESAEKLAKFNEVKAVQEAKIEEVVEEVPTLSVKKEQPEVIVTPKSECKEREMELSFKVVTTRSKLADLSVFLKENGIKYERIENNG